MERRPPSPAGGEPTAWLRAVGVAAAYYVLARLGLLFALPGSLASPIWPPAGLAIAAVALWRAPAAVGVLAGAVAAEYAGSGHVESALLLGLGNTLEACIGGFLLARFSGAKAFETVGGVGRLLGLVAIAPLASAGIGVGTLVAFGVVPVAAAPSAAWTWYLGDVAGALVVAPAILLVVRTRWRWPGPGGILEPLAAALVLLGLAAAILGDLPGVPRASPALLILLMPPLVWVGYRANPSVAAILVALVDAMAIAATRAGRGPFHAATPNDSFLLLQSFILTAAAIVLTLGALRAERRRAEELLGQLVDDRTAQLTDQVHEREHAEEAAKAVAAKLSATLESTQDAITVVDLEGRVTDWNRRFEELWRFPPGMLARGDADEVRGWIALLTYDPGGFREMAERAAEATQETMDVVRSRNGQVLERYSSPQELDGRVIGRVITYRDVTARDQAEADLRAANGALAQAQAIARVGSWSLDAQTRRAVASPELFRLFGVPAQKEPIDFADLQAHVDPADAAAGEALMAASLVMGSPISFDQHVRLEGQPDRILHIQGNVEEGPLRLLGTAQDVTRERAAEVALRASHAALGEAQRIAGLGSWDLDPATQTLQLSDQMCRLLGMPGRPAQVSAKDLVARIDPADLEAAQGALARSLQERCPLSIDARLRPAADAVGGASVWLHMEGRLDPRSGHMVGTAQDVTADRRIQADLRESLERFRVLAEGSPLGIFHTTLAGQVDYANARWMEIAGCDYHDFAAIRAAVHPEDRGPLTAAWRKALAAGQDLVADFRYVHQDGTVVECSTRASPVRDASGKVTGFVGTIEDATERHRLEARQREMDLLRDQARFKTEFLRTAAHELGNPMTPIKIQLRLLQQFVRHPEHLGGRHSVEILTRNVERLHLLVRDMLESARLQAGRLSLLPRGMDLSHTIHEVTETFQEAAIEHGIVLDLDAPSHLPMVGDPDRLTQVMYNLVANAMKFTPAGGRIHVQVERRGERARITVVDSGAGFTPDQAAGLFQPFGQVHDVVPGQGGTGLGLYISKGIVEQHGGTLEARSDGPGQGATFTVDIPLRAEILRPAQDAAAAADAEHEGHAAH